jgi:hypothetical protein
MDAVTQMEGVDGPPEGEFRLRVPLSLSLHPPAYGRRRGEGV